MTGKEQSMRSVAVLIITLSLGWAKLAHSTYPDFWKESPYAFECKGSSLHEILQDFSTSFGVMLKIDESVGGVCQGWVRADDAASFLELLAIKYRFNWFVFQQTLYISSYKDTESIRLTVDPNLKGALHDLGLYQKKFGWGDINEIDVALISGPKSYIKLIKNLLDENKLNKKNNNEKIDHKTYVISVKYASVSDRIVNVRGVETTIPGLKNVLANALGNVNKEKPFFDDEPESSSSDAVTSQVNGKKIIIQEDVRTNSLVIHSTDSKMNREYFKTLINRLDQAQKMIEIDAIIVDIDKNKLFELGAKNLSVTNKYNTGFELPSKNIDNSLLFVKNPGKFILELKALESKGNASIIANTSVLTIENQPAIIDLSETRFIQSLGERVANIDEFTTGTLLNVIPKYINSSINHQIKLVVDIEDGKFVDNGSDFPSIKKSNISTSAIIEKNQALVIGGYHTEERSKSVNGIPLLSRIPIAGSLFSQKVTRHSQRERVFILTPRISTEKHHAEAYFDFGNKHLISKALEKVKRRWQRASRNYAELFVKTAAQFSRSGEISGFKNSNVGELPFNCVQDDMMFDFEGLNKFDGSGITIFLGSVINLSDQSTEAFEASCFGKGLIGLSFIDNRLLDSGEMSRVMVAIETAKLINLKSEL